MADFSALYLLALAVAWKALATALVIVAVGVLARPCGPLLTSILLTMPFNAGPGFFFIALEAEPGFIAEGALTAFAATGTVLVFTATYVQAARGRSFLLPLLIGLAAWTGFAVALLGVELTMANAVAALLLGGLLAALIRRRLPTGAAAPELPASWRFLLVRGGAAGIVVAAVATASPLLGPVVSGLALSFPTTMAAAAWMLHGHYGQAFTNATLQGSQPSMVVYASFCLSLHLLAPALPGPGSVVAAIGCSLLIAALVGLWRWRRRAPAG